MAANAPQEGSNGAPSKPGGTTKQTQDEVGKALEHQMAIALAASLETEQQEAEARQESTVDALSDGGQDEEDHCFTEAQNDSKHSF